MAARRSPGKRAKPRSEAATPPAKSGPKAGTHPPRPRVARTQAEAARVAAAFERVRARCLAHPGVYEKEAWAAPTFRVEKGKMFLMVADNHHEDGRAAVWLMATADAREAWLEMEPERFFVPPYVGPSGWLGISLHSPVPWPLVEELIAEAAGLGGARASRPRGKGGK